MKEIKSIRIRNKKFINYINLDIKVTLYEDYSDIILNSDNNAMKFQIYKRNGIFSNYTNDDFIKSYIDLYSKLDNTIYEIIQDPWVDKAPIWRSYGFDPYYLNNSSFIIINWYDNDLSVGGKIYSDEDGIEIPNNFTKTLNIITKDDPLMHYNENGIDLKTKGVQKEWKGISDRDIIKEFIESWNTKIPGYGLDLCSPNYLSCSIIEYKSPLYPVSEEVEKPTISQINQLPKIKMNIIIPSGFLKVKSDVSLKVYIGDFNKEIDDYIYNPYDDDISEYLESSFEGLSEEEFNIQEEIGSNQIDSDANLESPGVPVVIKPVGSFDELLRLAGDCARELGKDKRVNYENLRIGYKKGIHGLCPQGTLSVLYALTGVKELGNIRGNANVFSFSKNGIKGLPLSHFNNKIRVDQEYFNNIDSWQIGDVIACDYINKNYGHIQIWTGFKWVSDFTQKTLQRNNVDWDSVALYRMNTNGILSVQNQKSNIS